MARTRAAIVAALAALCILSVAQASAAIVVGIGDQSPDTFSDPLFTPLQIRTGRVVAPWNVAATDPGYLGRWLTAADAAGVEPLVALGHAKGERCPDSPCVLPSDSAYVAAFNAIRANNPEVKLFTPWNEPNHRSQPTAGYPAAAAHYANLMAAACPNCTIIAGDLLDAPGMTNYLSAYKAALQITPAVWALHNYYDTNYFQTTATDAFLAAVDGPVWLTESGGIVTWRTADGQVQMPYDERRAAASVQWALQLAAARSGRVARIYLYQWQAGADDDFDAGLVRADGSARPGYDVVRSWLGVGATTQLDSSGQPVQGAVLAESAPSATPDALRARASIGRSRLSRRGVLGVEVSCASAPCRGALSVEGSGWAAQRFINGRLARGTLAPRRRPFMLTPGTRILLALRLPRTVTERARRNGIVLKLTLVPSRPIEAWGMRITVRLRVGGRR